MLSQPTHLRCEYFENPLCIDTAQPRLSWWVGDSRRNARQSAYQILVASSEANLSQDKGDIWDSRKIQSDQSVHVIYGGSALKSRQRCFWKVRTWDAQGQTSPWSQAAFWEMGLLSRDQWKAKW